MAGDDEGDRRVPEADDDAIRVAERLEALGTLAGGLAHDLNNILTVISTTSTLLRESLPPGEDHDARAHVRIIEAASTRGALLTRRLLTFGRPDHRPDASVDVAAVVAGSLDLLQRLAGASVRVLREPCHDEARARADPVQLEQVLLNLVVNAVDAMPHGGTVSLATRAVRLGEAEAGRCGLEPGGYVELSVRDTGEGIGPEVRRRMFQPFFTTKTGTGTGLGLSAVRRIVDEHGGAVTVESAPGRGATFRIWLPAG